ncbi:MAG: hypothetical protein OEM49_07125 [Myxococcales bacterium]|nr:hypothetical protein [Myxococcales bacterium]MDH5307792.1 hypothetical protein [Myxococcales bacterium]MDH5566954.1 hypothetical protein [Myxococcales bacterium]
MITGANTNVRYRGVVFHVQTEDSGRANPRIISHLYHGGTILASHKTDYADRMDAADLEGMVRGMIEAQHKDMLERLKRGAFDAAIAERLGDTAEEAGISADRAAPARPVSQAVEDVVPHAAERVARSGERAFGDGIVSQKPLDEVILEYLAEKARERASGRGERPARKTRSGG